MPDDKISDKFLYMEIYPYVFFFFFVFLNFCLSILRWTSTVFCTSHFYLLFLFYPLFFFKISITSRPMFPFECDLKKIIRKSTISSIVKRKYVLCEPKTKMHVPFLFSHIKKMLKAFDLAWLPSSRTHTSSGENGGRKGVWIQRDENIWWNKCNLLFIWVFLSRRQYLPKYKGSLITWNSLDD